MQATVIIPTFDHGPLLRSAARSVLNQSVEEFELFIIGDGVTEETREVIVQLRAMDRRVRFFDHPKSPRAGEPYRHLALQEATGRAICYLSDDDLWFPNHLEVFCRALEKLEVTHSQPFWVTPEGRVFSSLVDWGVPEWVTWTLQGRSPFGLSFFGHTLEFYRRLPHGWRTTPKGRWTDHYMYEQMLSVEGVRTGCTWQHTVIGFPSPDRRGWSPQQREEELLCWERKVAEEPGKLREQVQHSLSAGSFYSQQELEKWERRKTALTQGLARLRPWKRTKK